MRTKRNSSGILQSVILSIGLLIATGLSAQSVTRLIPKDNDAIQNDVSAVNSQKEKVEELQLKFKEDHRSGLQEMAVIDQKELSKARAELKKNKSFLMADVRDVTHDNRLAIRNSRKAIRLDKGDLRRSRKQLRNSERRGDEASAKIEKARVLSWQRILDSDIARLRLEKDKRAYDKEFLRKEMKRLQSGRQWVYLAGL